MPLSESRLVVVDDGMQRNHRYLLVEPAGRNFDSDFEPQLTPAEMLALGVFGGKYLSDCRDEFPASWFKRAKLSPPRKGSLTQLLWRGRIAAAQRVAKEGVDLS